MIQNDYLIFQEPSLMDKAHRSWSSVNDWNEELDELNLSFDKARLRALVVHFFQLCPLPHKDTHGSTPKSQDMPLVRRPIDWWPLWGTEECPTRNAGPDKKCGSLFTYRIEKHLSNVSFSSCITPFLTVEIKSTLISVGTLNESAASHRLPTPHSGILQPSTKWKTSEILTAQSGTVCLDSVKPHGNSQINSNLWRPNKFHGAALKIKRTPSHKRTCSRLFTTAVK